MKNLNSMWIGVTIGIIMSVISILAFYLLKFQDYTLNTYFVILFHTKSLFAPMVSLAGIPNLVFFYLFINKEKYKTARGIILATFILVLGVVLIKLFVNG